MTKEDIIEIIKYLIELINSKVETDDIDHLSNRRVRTVGEQLYNQFGVGLARMARTIRERMNVRDNEVFTPIDLINAKTISSVINSFFGTNALSQFMDRRTVGRNYSQTPFVGFRSAVCRVSVPDLRCVTFTIRIMVVCVLSKRLKDRTLV